MDDGRWERAASDWRIALRIGEQCVRPSHEFSVGDQAREITPLVA